jgi:hypothetical protein
MEILRDFGGAHQELFNVVKATPVDHPEFPDMAFVLSLRIPDKTPVEPHEKDRGPDPGDADGDVHPTPQQEEPFKKILIHVVPLFEGL